MYALFGLLRTQSFQANAERSCLLRPSAHTITNGSFNSTHRIKMLQLGSSLYQRKVFP